MNSNYISEFIPIELLSEILLYLNYEEIENVIKIAPLGKRLLNLDVFWKNKLKFDDMTEYIPYLGTLNTMNSFTDYYALMDINRKVIDFTNKFNIFKGRLSFEISDTIDVNQLISKDLFKFSEIMNEVDYSSSRQITIRNKKGNRIYSIKFLDGYIVHGKLTDNEFKLLLIKFYLSGIDVYELSNIKNDDFI